MEHVLKEVSLYDLTAYLIPGVVAVWSIMFVANAVLYRRKREHLKLPVIAVIIAGYITGHMLQAVATFAEESLLSKVWREPEFWQSPGTVYADNLKLSEAITSAVNGTFGELAARRPVYLCQTYLQAHHLDGFTEILMARYSFFKGLTLALFVSCCAFTLEAFWRRRPQSHPHRRRVLIMAGVLLVGTALSLWRTEVFEHYQVDVVYRTFYVDFLENKKPAHLSPPIQLAGPAQGERSYQNPER